MTPIAKKSCFWSLRVSPFLAFSAKSHAKQNKVTAAPIADWHALPKIRQPSRKAKAGQFGQTVSQEGGGQPTPYPRLGNRPRLRETPQQPTGILGHMLKLSSASRKHKYPAGGVRPVLSHESEEPRRASTPGSFLGKSSRHPRQSHLIGEGGDRLATSRPAALSVSEGAIGIPLLFLCP